MTGNQGVDYSEVDEVVRPYFDEFLRSIPSEWSLFVPEEYRTDDYESVHLRVRYDNYEDEVDMNFHIHKNLDSEPYFATISVKQTFEGIMVSVILLESKKNAIDNLYDMSGYSPDYSYVNSTVVNNEGDITRVFADVRGVIDGFINDYDGMDVSSFIIESNDFEDKNKSPF